MKTLTIQQPYASLIADSQKVVENRTWGHSYRGPIAIHAASGSKYVTPKQLAEYPTGAIIATARIITIVTLDAMRRAGIRGGAEVVMAGWTVADLLAHEHTEGPVCWILADVRKLAEPLPCKGRLGLWECDLDLTAN